MTDIQSLPPVTIRPEIKRRVGGRMCLFCRAHRRTCYWISPQDESCGFCLVNGQKCSGAKRNVPSSGELTEVPPLSPINIGASSPRVGLNTLILSYALNFSLIYEYDTHVRSAGYTHDRLDMDSMFDSFKSVRGKTSELAGLDEFHWCLLH